MITLSTPKTIHDHLPSSAVVPSGARKPCFTIGTLITRAELERNEWQDK
ncbi:hypothetical protein [Methanoregula sp.]